MKETYHQWYSSNINNEMRMLVFGDAGIPLLLFPSSMGKYYEAKDRKLIDAIAWFINNGIVKVYCPDSFDSHSWYNKSCSPAEMAWNNSCFDKLLIEEIIPAMQAETGHYRIITAGCSFGGYHALNFAFRHPAMVSYIFSMSGVFDIRSRTNGYSDDTIYYNNPVEYIPNAQDPALWNMGIILGTGEWDICRPQNELMSNILLNKNIKHWLDIKPEGKHDWPLWLDQLPHYLSLLPRNTST